MPYDPNDLLAGQNNADPNDLLSQTGQQGPRTAQQLGIDFSRLPKMSDISQRENISGGPRVLGDVISGLAKMGHGIVNAPSNIGRSLSEMGMIQPSTAAAIPRQQDYNYSSELGIPNPTFGDMLLQGAVKETPYLLGGGLSSIPRMAAAAGVEGLTQSESPFQTAAIQTAAVPLGVGALKLGGAALGKVADVVGGLKSGFMPGKVINTLKGALSPESIAAVENQGSDLYRPVLDAAKGTKLSINPADSSYIKAISEDPLTTKGSMKNLTQQYLQDPTFENAHELKKAISDRVIEFKEMAVKQGGLDTVDKNDMNAFMEAKNALSQDMNNHLSSINPSLADAFKSAEKNWATNVEPWRSSALALRNLGENASAEKIINKFSKLRDVARPISSNQAPGPSPIPEAISKTLEELIGAARNKAIATKAAITGAAIGGIGTGIKHFL